MIEFSTKDAENPVIHYSGKVTFVASEALAMISAIYKMVKEDDPDAAEAFKFCIEKGMDVTFLSQEECKKIVEESEKQVDEMLEKVSKALDTLKQLVNEKEVEKENEDIRSADFDSDDQFTKWFHGMDSEE